MQRRFEGVPTTCFLPKDVLVRANIGPPPRSPPSIVLQTAPLPSPQADTDIFVIRASREAVDRRPDRSPPSVLVGEKMPITALPQRSPIACALHSSASSGAPGVVTYRRKARGPHKRALAGKMCAAPAVSTEPAANIYTWTGKDEFDSLDDRIDAPPLPLPPIREARRVALVRHGQSTWNAEGRVQGSSNLSYLTKRGEAQAETTQQLLKDDRFDMLFHSPLKRADQTAQIIWGSRQGDVSVLPSLREVDLYSFQGLLKDEGKARYGDQYKKWQQDPAGFVIDDQAPIRELWYRASMAWQDILGAPGIKSALVVAHNAVNQALLNTALGLPPTFFRRLLQTNAATSVIDFQPNGDGPPTRTIDRMNQSPGSPFGTPKPGSGRIVLVRTGAAEGHREGLLLGVKDDPLSTLGRVQGSKAAELVMDVKVDAIYSSPLSRAKETAQSIADLQRLAGFSTPPVSASEDLNNRDWGSLEGRDASEVAADASGAAEPVDVFWERCGRAWSMLQAAAHENGGKTVAVVTHSSVISGILCRCLEMGPADLSLFRTGGGSITLIGFPDVAQADTMHKGVIQCTNFTAHLGRWAVPVTRDDAEYAVCGIDGCF